MPRAVARAAARAAARAGGGSREVGASEWATGRERAGRWSGAAGLGAGGGGAAAEARGIRYAEERRVRSSRTSLRCQMSAINDA
jgi:hypothetical protein